MSITFEGWQVFLAVFGPLIVAAVTGIETPSRMKSIIALIIITGSAFVQAYLSGAFGDDLFMNLVAVATVWQAMYKFWAALGLTEALQAGIPIAIGAEPQEGDSESE